MCPRQGQDPPLGAIHTAAVPEEPSRPADTRVKARSSAREEHCGFMGVNGLFSKALWAAASSAEEGTECSTSTVRPAPCSAPLPHMTC